MSLSLFFVQKEENRKLETFLVGKVSFFVLGLFSVESSRQPKREKEKGDKAGHQTETTVGQPKRD